MAVTMSPSTITALRTNGFSLYGFKAVQSSQQGGAPLVWFVDSTFLPTTVVEWEESYQAYVSTSQIILKDGVSAPMCAFELFGNNEDVIAPIEKVLLMFATQAVNTGTVIEQSFAPAVLLDLTANRNLHVAYDINTNWDFGGASWGTAIPASTELVPLLITSNQALKHAA